MDRGLIIDPNYPHHKVKRKDIRDYDYDTSLHPMYWEEMRHMKRRAIQYGRMHLPENPKAPARTIMAYYNSSSRESVIFETGKMINYQGKKRKVFRQPTVREIACIQGFPLDFQLSARRIADRYKLIGNAVPCQLAYAHAKSILQDMTKNNQKSGEKYFLKRLSVTTKRRENNNYLPIISSPNEIIDEAVDNKRVHAEFGAQYNKHLRRKLLSSTIPGDSNIIIFENSDMVDSKLMGTHRWKSCLQRGIGKQYHQIFLDEISIDKILNSLDLRHKRWKDQNGIKDTKSLNILKSLLRHLFSEVDRGIPTLKDTWTEFPGWDNIPQDHSSLFTGKRKRLPDIILFQVAFTNGIKQIDGVIGPIDFFDGLDAIMLRVFNSKKFRSIIKELAVIKELYDQDIYPHRSDSRISTSMKNVKIPLVTIMAGLLSVYILYKMYKNIKMENNHAYFKSLKKAHDKMKKWCIYPQKNH